MCIMYASYTVGVSQLVQHPTSKFFSLKGLTLFHSVYLGREKLVPTWNVYYPL